MQNRLNALGSALSESIKPPPAILRHNLLVEIFFMHARKACIEARSFLVIGVIDVELNFRFRKNRRTENIKK